MAKSRSRSSSSRTAGGRAGGRAADRRRPAKKKVCIFCSEKAPWVDYKDVNLLRRFMSERAKIRARRVTGNCAQHQREVATAIKTARELALLPYGQRQVTERAKGGGRGRRDREDILAAPVEMAAPVEEMPEAEEVLEAGAEVEAEGAEMEAEGVEMEAEAGGMDEVTAAAEEDLE
jgi:small subunit ribosomal protein S18